MFKIALRISALLLLVVASFYCGRASKQTKCEAVAFAEVHDSLKPFDGQAKPNYVPSIEFQLRKSSPIFDKDLEFAEIFIAPEKTRDFDRNMHYPIELDEANQRFLFKGQRNGEKTEISGYYLANNDDKNGFRFTFILGGFER